MTAARCSAVVAVEERQLALICNGYMQELNDIMTKAASLYLVPGTDRQPLHIPTWRCCRWGDLRMHKQVSKLGNNTVVDCLSIPPLEVTAVCIT